MSRSASVVATPCRVDRSGSPPLPLPPCRRPPVALEGQDEMSQVERTFSDLSYRNVGPSRGGACHGCSRASGSPPDVLHGCYRRWASGRPTTTGTTWRPISDGLLRDRLHRLDPRSPIGRRCGVRRDGLGRNPLERDHWPRPLLLRRCRSDVGAAGPGRDGSARRCRNSPGQSRCGPTSPRSGTRGRKAMKRGVYRTSGRRPTRGSRCSLPRTPWARSISSSTPRIRTRSMPVCGWAVASRGRSSSGMEASAQEDGIWKSTDGG